MKNIVVIGGGTGSYVTVKGLKQFANQINISVIVTVADSGGSAKQERDEFGLLPVSDVRKALLALAKETDDRRQWVIRELFNYRFDRGLDGVKGGTFGNLFLVALTEILGSEEAAIEEAEQILQTEGKVIPVSLLTSNLVMVYENGQTIVGEHYLDEFPGDGSQKVVNAYLLPKIKASQGAIDAILKADLIVFPPGDLFASVIVNLLVERINDAVQKSNAKIVYIINLMTKYGQTYKLSAKGHVNLLEKYLPRKIDYIMINKGNLPLKIVKVYEAEKDYPVKDDLGKNKNISRGDYLNNEKIKVQKGDQLKRSLIRHDPYKLAKAIMGLI